MVGPAGEQLGVLTIEAALEQANQFGMDLVEVNPYFDASRRTAVLAARVILEALSAVFDPRG